MSVKLNVLEKSSKRAQGTFGENFTENEPQTDTDRMLRVQRIHNRCTKNTMYKTDVSCFQCVEKFTISFFAVHCHLIFFMYINLVIYFEHRSDITAFYTENFAIIFMVRGNFPFEAHFCTFSLIVA